MIECWKPKMDHFIGDNKKEKYSSKKLKFFGNFYKVSFLYRGQIYSSFFTSQ